MKKKTKLAEKPARILAASDPKKESAIAQYLQEIAGLPGESARSHRFTALLQALFGVQPGFIENYVGGIEKYLKVKEKDRIIRGRADQLSGSLIIEFERDLSNAAKLKEAESQLRQYAASAWSDEPSDQRLRYVCLATDGLLFRAYAPISKDPAAVIR